MKFKMMISLLLVTLAGSFAEAAIAPIPGLDESTTQWRTICHGSGLYVVIQKGNGGPRSGNSYRHLTIAHLRI